MTRPNQHPPVTRADADRIVALYRAGGSLVQVAALTGRSGTTVQKVLRECGVPTRAPGVRPADLPRLSMPTSEELAYTGGWKVVRGVRRPTEPRPPESPPMGRPPKPDPPCGTERGYQRHRHLGEDCEQCRAAHAAHNAWKQQQRQEAS